jgi:regulator of G-protein signaling
MESIVEKMQSESGGVAVRTVKAFMSKIPSVFSGADRKFYLSLFFALVSISFDTFSSVISWILKNMDVEDPTEALHIAHLLSSHGYLFPIVS